MAIYSQARASAIIEAVAEKHQVSVQTLLCAKWDRYAMASRAEAAHELKVQLKLSQRAIGAQLGCTQPNVRKLFGIHEMNVRQAKRWLPVADVHAIAAIDSAEAKRRALEAEERAAELEQELARLTGKDLALSLMDAVELGGKHGGRVGGVILLAILCENYPNVVLGPNVLRLYDEACERLGFGSQRGAGFVLITSNAKNINQHFRARDWPLPIETGEFAGSRRLTDDAAIFLHERAGAPRRSQIEMAAERRSAPVPASAR